MDNIRTHYYIYFFGCPCNNEDKVPGILFMFPSGTFPDGICRAFQQDTRSGCFSECRLLHSLVFRVSHKQGWSGTPPNNYFVGLGLAVPVGFNVCLALSRPVAAPACTPVAVLQHYGDQCCTAGGDR